MLSASVEDIRLSCENLRQQIADLCDAEVVECQAQVGGGSAPGATLASLGIKITGTQADVLAESLRTGSPAVQARVTDDSLLLDLRTVGNDQLKGLTNRLRDSLVSASSPGHK